MTAFQDPATKHLLYKLKVEAERDFFTFSKARHVRFAASTLF
jgi:hypothetical protein